MQIVIDIPEEDYNNIEPFLNGQTIKGGFNLFKVLEIIKNGIPLPKGHGRLGDLDIILNKAIKYCELYSKAVDSYCRGKLHAYEMYAKEVKNVDTIIEADMERSDGE